MLQFLKYRCFHFYQNFENDLSCGSEDDKHIILFIGKRLTFLGDPAAWHIRGEVEVGIAFSNSFHPVSENKTLNIHTNSASSTPHSSRHSETFHIKATLVMSGIRSYKYFDQSKYVIFGD